MSAPVEPRIKQALRKKPAERTPEDLNTIYSFLHGLDILSHFREHQLRIMSSSARYERYKGNQVLFCSETIARCWYILLSGSVLMKDSMFLPPCSKRRRPKCLDQGNGHNERGTPVLHHEQQLGLKLF